MYLAIKIYIPIILLLACIQVGMAQSQVPLTNKDVIDIVKIGLSEEVVLAKIKASKCKFDTSVEALIELKSASIPDSVIMLMIDVNTPKKEESQPTAKPNPNLTPTESRNYRTPDKNGRAWRRGIVRDTEKETFTTYGRTTTQGRVDANGNIRATTTRPSWEHERYTFVVEGDDYIYVVSHVLSWRWSKEVKVTVNGPVFYAVDGDKLYILDEKEREFKLEIDKKILKEKK